MGFDTLAFEQAKFSDRTEAVNLPGLSPFYSKGEDPIWTVRGLTATELAAANEAAEKRNNTDALVQALAGDGPQGDKVKQIRAAIGLQMEVPGELAKRLSMLAAGSVDPICDMPTAVKMAKYRPVEFFQLTNVITKLTGLGSNVEVKLQPSGKTPPSGDA
jgi:hypothetical protein